MDRRDFIKLLIASSLALPAYALPQLNAHKKRYLVLIELKGGNDGLNTVIPYTNKLYYENRPSLAIPADKVLPIDKKIGLHPALSGLKSLFDNRELALIQNIGYEKPNLSHFKSLDIWQRASKEINDIGWIYRLFDQNQMLSSTLNGIVFNGSTGYFRGQQPRFLKINGVRQFIKQGSLLEKQLQAHDLSKLSPAQIHLLHIKKLIINTASELKKDAKSVRTSATGFPDTVLGKQLKDAATMIDFGFDVPVIKVSLKGFDTHAEQKEKHDQLLKDLNDSMLSFATYMQQRQLWDQVLLVTYSEFGRRVAENGNKGTDHGAASCLFCTGGKVKGGLYGGEPDLNNLIAGNLAYKIDFRQLYASIENEWFRVKQPVISKKYPPLNIINNA